MLTGSQQQELLSSAEIRGDAPDTFDRSLDCDFSQHLSVLLSAVELSFPALGSFELQHEDISQSERSETSTRIDTCFIFSVLTILAENAGDV